MKENRLKKATTLRSLLFAATVTIVDIAAGYAMFGDAKIYDHNGAILLSMVLIISALLTMVLGFMAFISFLTEIFINASGAKFVREKTGSPFHYLLWDELREKIENG